MTNKTAFNLTAQRNICKSKYQASHSTGRLASKFAIFVSDWKHLEHYGCSCLCQPRTADTDSTRTSSSEILEINFFDHCEKFHRFDARQTEGSHQKQRRHCSTNIEPMHCFEVMLSSHYCASFGCCNTTEYYNCCWAAVCIIFSSNNSIYHTYRTCLPVSKVYNIQVFAFKIVHDDSCHPVGW